ncbi:hypothetical protein PS906_05303 [Pseudomonas fluorescens]|nr:hypothetical protein PS906_05303 [Pseudomonas fluorescens]
MFFQRSLAKESVNVGVEGDIEFGVEAAFVGGRRQRMQVFPALLGGRLCLIAWKVFLHVCIEAHYYVAKVHLIQLTELCVAQSIALIVVGLGRITRPLVYVPATQCSIGSNDLFAWAEQGRILDGCCMGEQ